MEVLKRQVKRITSIILIITILVGVLPNFGLLKESKATTDIEKGVILKQGSYDAENKVFSIELSLKNLDATAIDITFCYPSDIVETINYIKYEAGVVEASTTQARTMEEPLEEFYIDTGAINDANINIFFNGECCATGTDITIARMYFHIKDDTISIDDITNKMFRIINTEEDPNAYFAIVTDDSPEGEYTNEFNMFLIRGFTEAPLLESLSIKTNPTEGQKYIHGKEIDLTGLELEATYSDNTTKTIYIDDPDLKITTGEKIGAFADINEPKITFKYEEKITTLDVDVIDPVVKIEVIDEDDILMQGIDSGEKIPKDEEGLYVKTTTASGNINQVPLNDERITLDSDKADINKVPADKQQSVGGGTFAGPQTITVTYKESKNEEGITTNFDILVNDIVDRIEISTINSPIKEFTINDIFTKSGAIVIVGASGHEYDEIPMSSDSVKVTELDGKAVDLSNMTSRELLVSFGKATVKYEITIKNKVESIKVNSNTIILKYDKKINEQQDLFSGITVTEIMADGTEGDTKNLDFSWIQNTDCYDADTYNHKLTVWYNNDKNIVGEIPVRVINEVRGIEVTGLEDKKFVYNDTINYEGVEVSIKYVNGEVTYRDEEILDLLEYTLENDGLQLTVNGFDSSVIENNQKVTFTYSEDGSQTVSTDVFVNIGKATLEVPECEVIEIYEGKKLSTVADKLPETEYGKIEWKNPDKTLTYSEEEQVVDATYKMNATYSEFYEDVDCKIKVKVLQNTVASIEVLDESTNTKEYVEGQNFDPIGMKIKVTYESGDEVTVTVDENTKGITYAPSENLQVGTDAITVTYGGKTATQSITVEAKKVTSIEVTQPTKNEYVAGQNLDLTGMTITATYNDNTKKDITADTSKYTVSPENGDELNTVGTQTITVTYIGTDIDAGATITDSTTVEVEAKKVTSIEVTQPTKNEYVAGQNLDLTGMTITATYNDNTKKDITADTSKYTVSPENGDELNTVGTQTITVTYIGTDIDAGATITDSTTVEVEAKVVTEIKVTTAPENTEYIEGHPFDKTGMVVTAYYNDGTNAETEDYEISPKGNLGRTDTTITINYTGTDIKDETNKPTAIVTITVTPREIEKIEITKAPDKVNYFEGQNFDPTGMEITVTYNDHENPLVIKDDYTNITFNPSVTEALKTTDTGITVTYEGHTKTQPITVEEDYVTEITVSYPNNFQQVGKNVDLTNTTIQKKWASELSHGADDTEAVTLDMISSTSIVDGKFTVPGTVEITVTYDNGKIDKPTAKFEALVEDAIQSITLNNINTSYWVGDEIDNSLAITVNYANPANNKTIVYGTDDWKKCSIEGIDMSKPGTYTLKVAYGDYKTEGKIITVKDYVTEIRVVNNKLIYKLNENGSFNIQVNKYMASEPSKAIPVIKNEYSLSIPNVDTTTVNTTDVTVSYKNEKNETLTDKFNVQVINATAKAVLETTPTTMPKNWGDALNLDGASIKVEKQDGTYDTINLPNSAVTVSAYNSKTLAPQTISFTYKYKELNEINVEVEKAIPVEGTLNITLKDYWTGEIRISGVPTTSIKGQELDLGQATVSKIMASGAIDGTTPILSSMISNFDKNIEGKQTITITHFGKSATCDVTVTDYITSISMNKLPNKVNYTKGEAIDVTGAVLNVIKQSGKVEEIAITKEMISGYNSNKVGQQTIIVDYYGFKTSFIVTVKSKTTDKPVTPTKPTNPTKPSKPSDNTPIEDKPIVPEETKKYLVTFVNYDGTIIKTEEVESGKSATEPKVKTRKGYKFIGWDKEFDVVEEDMEITAQYEKIKTIKESPKPTQTLGEKDEVKEESNIQKTLIPATIGLGITGLLLLLIAILTKKNVEIYAIYDEERKLIGREKISKHNTTILLDAYKSKLENAKAVEIEINEKTVEKLEGEIVQVVIDDKTKKYKMTNKIVIKK